MSIEKRYSESQVSNLVIRRDFSKSEINFTEPDLLEIQRNSYKNFLDKELAKLIEEYFPISHAKNNKYTVKYYGINLVNPTKTEQECRDEGLTYERSLYVDLGLLNNETGEEKRSVKDTKQHLSKGVFFGNIPLMTERGTFIVNGIEKVVVSQIVRSPGVYILNQSQIKLNNKKKIIDGKICEILPNRGTLINLVFDDKEKDKKLEIIRILMRDSTGKEVVDKPATSILKAFGMGQDEILRLFNNDRIIINTLAADKYNHNTIVEDKDIRKIISNIDKLHDELESVISGSPIDAKLTKKIKEYNDKLKQKKILEDKINFHYNTNFAKIKEIESNFNNTKGQEKIELENKLKAIKAQGDKLYEQKDKLENDIKKCLDIIITEKAAKDLIEALNISTRAIETEVSSKTNPVCYQDIITEHFMVNRKYNLSSAGRYRTLHKMHISDRLYQRTIAQDVYDNKNKIIIPKNTFINKAQLDIFKKLIQENKLHVGDEISLNVSSKCENKIDNKVEKVLIYVDNDHINPDQDETTPIIGLPNNTNVHNYTSLTLADFVCCMSYVINFSYEIGTTDEIDHLGNKRLRLVGEQLKSKLQVGLARVEKQIKDKLASISIPTANQDNQKKTDQRTTIRTVVNTKPFQFIIKAFFNTNQLTQFVDQQNPLSELSNKRRLSAMGDGGIYRDDPNLDIRDIHYSHYGRICPIETPEGQNIGLIMSLASYAKIDENGFLITPYHRVINGVIQKDVEWITPLREDEYYICEATIPHDSNNKLIPKQIICRYRGNQKLVSYDKVDYIDIAPRQIVSVATSEIPFLEHNDANRALMGANMQRQAVPLIHPIAPIVGTGSEYKIAHDSGLSRIAKNDGVVEKVDGNSITIQCLNGKANEYILNKFIKSNQNTCINHQPIVSLGQKIKANQIIADGPAMYNGELALGRNPLVAFTTWNGYNYEDAIVISERLVKDDVYTSISLDVHSINCVESENGDEIITRDIPNVSEDAKRYLDEDGIIMVGAEVHEDDILVGKITPRGQDELSGEEKLLFAIFGNKTKNYRNSSLKVPHGGDGIVVKVERYTKDDMKFEDNTIELIKVTIAQKRKIQIGDKMSGRHGNKGCISIVAPIADMPFMEDGTPIDICLNPLGVPSRMNIGQVLEINLGLSMRLLGQQKIIEFALEAGTPSAISKLYTKYFGLIEEKAKVLAKLICGYLKNNNITSLVEAKKKISYNDIFLIIKNAGLDVEDINYKASTPVFGGATVEDVIANLAEAGLDTKNKQTLGKFQLYDGKTGEPFDGLTTVGVMYMLKLDHMVDDKIHARDIGPYSKITQQPLGGKSQNGGQRFGEMEVWAMEAYGAKYNLQELMTIKSDDDKSKSMAYLSIVNNGGHRMPEPGIPESFKLLTKILQGLGICINVLTDNNRWIDINKYTSVFNDVELEEQGFDNAVDNYDQVEKDFNF